MTLPGSSGRPIRQISMLWRVLGPILALLGVADPPPPSSYGGEPSPVIKCAAVETPLSSLQLARTQPKPCQPWPASSRSPWIPADLRA